MKALVTSFNKKLGLNPMIGRLFDSMPIERAGADSCEVVFYSFVAPESDFDLDLTQLEIVSRHGVPVIVFDHEEVFGRNFFIGCNSLTESSRYFNIHKWLTNAKVLAYFKRELTPYAPAQDAVTFPIYPLDWTLQTIVPAKVDSAEEYNKRPIDVFMSWGYSNESRPRLMGELLKQAGRFNAHFCLTEEDLDIALKEGRERIFALLFTPHYRRIHYSKLFAWQQQSKVSVSMFGAGMKCFRCAEASYNSVMAQEVPEAVQWSYPWHPGENCIGITRPTPSGTESVDQLYVWLRLCQGSLYDIYLKGTENNRHYHNATYATEYLWPRIQKALA